jgi:hypothetical protein
MCPYLEAVMKYQFSNLKHMEQVLLEIHNSAFEENYSVTN